MVHSNWYSEAYDDRPVVLLLAWRDRRDKLHSGRLELAGAPEAELRGSVLAQLQRLDDMRPVSQSGAPLAEPGEEYFHVSVPTLAPAPDEWGTNYVPSDTSSEIAQEKGSGSDEESVGELIQVLYESSEASILTPSQVRNGTFLFFAVVLHPPQPGGHLVAAVRIWNPRRGIKPGRLVTHFANRVEALENPVLIFDPDYDLIVSGGHAAYFTQTAFDRLFKDLSVLQKRLPSHVDRVAETFPLASHSKSALMEACSKRVSYGKRLERLVVNDQLPQFGIDEFVEKLEEFGFQPADFVNSGELSFAANHVGVVLDYFEELYYRTLFTGVPKRADRHRDI